jgi:5-methylcytosine-specific restriction protein A
MMADAVRRGVQMMRSRLVADDLRRIKPSDGESRKFKRVDSFYVSPEWKSFRNALIKERGWRCEDPKCETPRGPWKQIYGHHIIEIADGGAKLDRKNVLLNCGVCHGRVTQQNKAKRAGWLDYRLVDLVPNNCGSLSIEQKDLKQ